MRQYRLALLSAVTLTASLGVPGLGVLSLGPVSVGPVSLGLVTLSLAATAGDAAACPREVIVARAALGPTAPQSLAAQLHRQPTVASVAAAEKRLGAAFGCPAEGREGRPQRRPH